MTAELFEGERKLDWTAAWKYLEHALSQAFRTRPGVLREQSGSHSSQDGNQRNSKASDYPTAHMAHPIVQTRTRCGISNGAREYPPDPSTLTWSRRPSSGDISRARSIRPGAQFAIRLRLIPMIVGSILPITLLLSIISITGQWIHDPTSRVPLANERNAITRDDVGVVHGTSIAALICNMISVAAFVVRCLERQILMATLVNIIFSLAAATCHLVGGLVFIAGHPLGPSQTYDVRLCCAFISTGFSLITTFFLLYDWRVIHNFRHCGSGLTDRQRVLFLIIIMFFSWLVVGVLLFALLERWDVVTALYFSLITVSSIGFGDYILTRNLSRAFLFPYGIIGIILFGSTINAIHTVVIEAIETVVQAKVGRFYEKRRVYRERFKSGLHKKLFYGSMLYSEPKGSRGVDAHPIQRNIHPRSRWSRISRSIPGYPQPLGRPLSTPLTEEKPKTSRPGSDDRFSVEDSHRPQPISLEEHMQRVSRQRRVDSIIQFTFALISWLIFWLIGAVIFSALLDITYYDAFYFCFVSFTTIGYGKITPHSDTSKIVFIFFVLVGIAAITYFVSTTTGIWRLIVKHHMKRTGLRRRLRQYYAVRFNYWRHKGHKFCVPENWWRWVSKLFGMFIPPSENNFSADHGESKDRPIVSTGNESPPKDADSTKDVVAPYSHQSRRPDPLTDPLVAFALRDHLEDLREAIRNFDVMAALLVHALRLAVAQQDPALANKSHHPHSDETVHQLSKTSSHLPSLHDLPKNPGESLFASAGRSGNLKRDDGYHPNLKTILQTLEISLVAPANFKYHEDSLLHPKMIPILDEISVLQQHPINPGVHLHELESYYAAFTRIIGLSEDILNRL
ncbi:Potassium channel [Dispira simplex]|nr:Potassium channel [Dispira simplex]